MATLVVGDLDIAQLSNEELYQQLTDLGETVGPIVGTTRKVYQRILAKKLRGNVSMNSFSEADNTKETSDDEPDVEPSQAYIERASSGSLRQRKVISSPHSTGDFNEVDDDDQSEEEYLTEGDQHRSAVFTPSPRRPLHAGKDYTDSSFTRSLSPRLEKIEENNTETEKSGMGSLLLKIFLILAIFAALYLILMSESKDEFSRLGHMAETAGEAIEKERKAKSGL